jgi:ribonuclease P protein component
MKLVNSDEFTAVFDQKKRLSSENLFLYYRPNEMGKNRLGFVVPKRIQKLAVRRNYMRRSLREIFKSILNSNHNCSFDFVVSIKKTFYKDEFHSLKTQVDSLILKLPQKKK